MTADLSALIARLEAAEVGSRELDADIARAMGWEVHNARRNGLWVVPFGAYDTCDPEAMFTLGNYTTSLDAALALAERLNVKRLWNLWKSNSGYVASFEGDNYSRSATPALALVIAILRAKQGEG